MMAPAIATGTTVRETVLQLLRAFGMRRIFGNPGSTELPLFVGFPPDFDYVLGLQESVVVGMADGPAGIADFAYVNPGYQPGRFPVIAGAGLPFIFSSGKGGSAAIDAWYRQYAAREMKDVKFCFAFIHDPGTFHSKKKLLLPTDVKGLKVRPATSTIGQMVTLLGGTNVQASAPEARDMLERGVADAITFPWGSISLFGIDKVVTQHMDVPLYTTPFVWVMNKDKYDGMSAAQKKVIDEHCTTEWAEKVASPWADFEFGGRAKLAGQPGHESYKLTTEQLDAWRKAVAPTEATWAEGASKAGYDPKQAMESLKSTVAKYKSGF
jgi:TRAP-type C4-dicarboxylate transport system substrate-binding protein